jgi:hypothetical protein
VQIIRVNEQVPVKIGEVTFWLSPLRYQEKSELLRHYKMKQGEERVDNTAYAFQAVKMSLKEIEGVKLVDGSPFVLEFDERGHLTDDCLENVLLLNGQAALLFKATEAVIYQDSESILKEPGLSVDFSKARAVKKK